MKDYSEAQWRDSPQLTGLDPLYVIKFCLDCIFADNQHTAWDTLTRCLDEKQAFTAGGKSLTYEELIGALLEAEKEILEYRAVERRQAEAEEQ